MKTLMIILMTQLSFCFIFLLLEHITKKDKWLQAGITMYASIIVTLLLMCWKAIL